MFIELRSDSIRIMKRNYFDAKRLATYVENSFDKVVVFERVDFFEVRASESMLFSILFDLSCDYQFIVG